MCHIQNTKPHILNFKGSIRDFKIKKIMDFKNKAFDYTTVLEITLECSLYVECDSTVMCFVLCFFLLGRLDDQYIIRFIKEKLKSVPCRNQGYILDGFPKTYDQAKDLFNRKSECSLYFECLHSVEL